MPSLHRDHYEVLGVERDATAQDIHRAYRGLARRYHPDVYAGADARSRFDEVTAAYEVLRDRRARNHYDRYVAPVGAASQRVGTQRAPSFSPPRSTSDVPRFLDEVPNPVFAVSAQARERQAPFAGAYVSAGQLRLSVIVRGHMGVRRWPW